MIFMIKITDALGVEHNLNLHYVVGVSLAGGDNLNEVLVMTNGDHHNMLAGTWAAALAALFAEFNANPQPMPNVKDKVFIAT